MSLVRLIARPLLATVFVVQGANSLRNPEPLVPAAAKLAEQFGPTLERRAPGFPTDPATLVRINGGAQLAAGLALATGRLPRLASLILLGTLVPSTVLGAPYAEQARTAADGANPEAAGDADAVGHDFQRVAERQHLMKNLGLAGGLLLASVDTAGKPGLSWRARRAARDAKRATHTAKREARMTALLAARRARSRLTES